MTDRGRPVIDEVARLRQRIRELEATIADLRQQIATLGPAVAVDLARQANRLRESQS